MQNILFYGGSSLLSYMWINQIQNKSNIFFTEHNQLIDYQSCNKIKINQTNYDILKEILIKKEIKVLINCVGLTNVEKCESNKNLSNYLNSEIPNILAKASMDCKTKFIHISTDHLFDGLDSFYTEKDIVNPINQYAKSKHIGEKKVLENNDEALVIRTNFFGKGPKHKLSFSDLIIKYLESNNKIGLFSDVFYTPIHISELVRAVDILIQKNQKGIFHIVSNERISKYEFGILIAEEMNISPKMISEEKIVNRLDLNIRPKDMSLSNYKLKATGDINIIPIRQQIKNLIKKNDI